MAERAEFQATIDLSAVDKGITQTRDKITGMGGAVGNALGQLEGGAGKASAAMGALKMTLGNVNIAGSQLAQSVTGLAQSFAAGGGLGIAMAAAGLAAKELVGYWDDLIKKQDELLRKQYLVTDDAGALSRKAHDDVLALRRELAQMGMSDSDKAYLNVQAEIDAVTAKLAGMRQAGKWWTEEEIKAAKILEGTLKALNEKQFLSADLAERRRMAGAPSGGRRGSGGVAAGADEVGPGAGGGFSMSMIEEDPTVKAKRLAYERALDIEIDGENKLRDVQWESAQQYEALAVKAEEQKQAAIQEVADRAMIERLEKERQFAAAAMDLTQASIVAPLEAAASTGIGVLNDYWQMRAVGEKDAEAKATAAFMKGIGSQLVGIGTRSLFEGGAKLFNPVTAPIGAAEIAFGGVAIAAGMGLGAGGAAVGARVAPGSGAASKAATDRGTDTVGRGSGGGSRSGSGGLTVQISYGVMGPPAEDTARAVGDALRLHNRRRFS